MYSSLNKSIIYNFSHSYLIFRLKSNVNYNKHTHTKKIPGSIILNVPLCLLFYFFLKIKISPNVFNYIHEQNTIKNQKKIIFFKFEFWIAKLSFAPASHLSKRHESV